MTKSVLYDPCHESNYLLIGINEVKHHCGCRETRRYFKDGMGLNFSSEMTQYCSHHNDRWLPKQCDESVSITLSGAEWLAISHYAQEHALECIPGERDPDALSAISLIDRRTKELYAIEHD